MITVAIFNSIVVFFATLAKSVKSDYWLKISFVSIFLFLALRYDYGNDYRGYLDGFVDIEYLDYSSKYELGWQLLCLLFKPLGFFVMTAFLAAFNCYAYYSVIKKYVDQKYYWFVVFIYVFNPYGMLVLSSAMRQSIAIDIFLLSLSFIHKKNIVLYFLCIGLATMFHQSAAMLFVLYFIGQKKWEIHKFVAIFVAFFYAIIYFLVDQLVPYAQGFIALYFDRYSDYTLDGSFTPNTGLSFIYNIFMFLLYLLYSNSIKNKSYNYYLLNISIVGFFLLPLTFLGPIVGRTYYYLQTISWIVLSLILVEYKDYRIRFAVIIPNIFITLYSFYGFFNSPTWIKAFGTYKTIFSSPYIY